MPVSEIDVDALAALDTEAIQLVDVREPDEYEEARVRGAVLIPLMTIPENLERLDSSKPLYLICAAGGRSMNAAEFLDQHGFDSINIAGGTKGWIAAGHDVDSGPVES